MKILELADTLDRLHAVTTQGPWENCGSERGGCICGMVWSKTLDASVCAPSTNSDAPQSRKGKEDAAFIAASHEAVPLFIAALRDVSELVEMAQDLAQFISSQRHTSNPSSVPESKILLAEEILRLHKGLSNVG